MGQGLQIGPASLALSLGVVATALVLGAMLWHDRRRRGTPLSPADAEHFARQDGRRLVGAVVMLLLASGIYFGSRVSPRLGDRANPLFVEVWLGIFLLIFFLLLLAMLDLMSVRLYARRHRDAIARERSAVIKEELDRLSAPSDDEP